MKRPQVSCKDKLGYWIFWRHLVSKVGNSTKENKLLSHIGPGGRRTWTEHGGQGGMKPFRGLYDLWVGSVLGSRRARRTELVMKCWKTCVSLVSDNVVWSSERISVTFLQKVKTRKTKPYYIDMTASLLTFICVTLPNNEYIFFFTEKGIFLVFENFQI